MRLASSYPQTLTSLRLHRTRICTDMLLFLVTRPRACRKMGSLLSVVRDDVEGIVSSKFAGLVDQVTALSTDTLELKTDLRKLTEDVTKLCQTQGGPSATKASELLTRDCKWYNIDDDAWQGAPKFQKLKFRPSMV